MKQKKIGGKNKFYFWLFWPLIGFLVHHPRAHPMRGEKLNIFI
jgi:hypothetical protein